MRRKLALPVDRESLIHFCAEQMVAAAAAEKWKDACHLARLQGEILGVVHKPGVGRPSNQSTEESDDLDSIVSRYSAQLRKAGACV